MDKKVTLSTKANAVGRTAVVPSKSKTFLDAMGAFGEALQTGTQVLQAENEEQFKRGLEQAAAGYSEENLPRNSKAYARGYYEFLGKADAAKLADVANTIKQINPDNPEVWRKEFEKALTIGEFQDYTITTKARMGSDTYKKHFQAQATQIANSLKMEGDATTIKNLKENNIYNMTVAGALTLGNISKDPKAETSFNKISQTLFKELGYDGAKTDKVLMSLVQDAFYNAPDDKRSEVLSKLRMLESPKGYALSDVFAKEFEVLDNTLNVNKGNASAYKIKVDKDNNAVLDTMTQFFIDTDNKYDDEEFFIKTQEAFMAHPNSDRVEMMTKLLEIKNARLKYAQSEANLEKTLQATELESKKYFNKEAMDKFNKQYKTSTLNLREREALADIYFRMSNLNINKEKLALLATSQQDRVNQFNKKFGLQKLESVLKNYDKLKNIGPKNIIKLEEKNLISPALASFVKENMKDVQSLTNIKDETSDELKNIADTSLESSEDWGNLLGLGANYKDYVKLRMDLQRKAILDKKVSEVEIEEEAIKKGKEIRNKIFTDDFNDVSFAETINALPAKDLKYIKKAFGDLYSIYTQAKKDKVARLVKNIVDTYKAQGEFLGVLEETTNKGGIQSALGSTTETKYSVAVDKLKAYIQQEAFNYYSLNISQATIYEYLSDKAAAFVNIKPFGTPSTGPTNDTTKGTPRNPFAK